MRLRKYLDENNLNYLEFASTIGVHEVSLYRYLKGTRRPKPDIIKRIAALTNGDVTFNDFYA